MARSSLKILVDQKTPLNLENKGGRQLLRKVIRHLEGILGGSVSASHIQVSVDGAQPIPACGIIAAAAVAAADTLTVNGTTVTATEKRANCTVTLANVSAGDTVTVNGVVFTAVNGGTPTAVQFDMSGTDAADASSLVSAINASTHASISGLIEAVRPAANGVVNIYAITTGTAGNSYTIATSNGTRLAITNDNSGVFDGGAATVNNVFDPMGNNPRTATEIARAINVSSTALIAKNLEASSWSAVVTLATCTAGTKLFIGSHEFTALAAANSTPQGSVGGFTIAGSDTADGDALAAAINTHPVLCHDLFAVNAAGTVTIHQRRGTSAYAVLSSGAANGVTPSGLTLTSQFAAGSKVCVSSLCGGQDGNTYALASSDGTRLALTNLTSGRMTGGTGAESGTQVNIVMGRSAA